MNALATNDPVVVLQAATQPTGLDPDHRVGYRIEAWSAIEDVNRDGVGFDPIGMPGKSFLHDELQKALLPAGVDDSPAPEDTLERVLDELVRDRFVGIV